MNKIKFAIIGYGNIGKRHKVHIQAHANAELVGICDVDELKHEHNDIPFFNNVNDMYAQLSIDVICVCTPNYLHHIHTIQALQTKINVLCEKPMSIATNLCEEMIEAANMYNKKIFVVKQNRYNEPVQQVKKLIENRLLGKIYLININCFWNRNEAYYQSEWRGKKSKDGGCLYTQFSHFIDILYYLNGDITTIKGYIENYNHVYTEIEDTGSFTMKAKNGAIVNFNFTTCSYEKNMEGAITIIAEKGTVKIGGQYMNTIEYQNIQDTLLPAVKMQNKANDYGTYQGSMSNHDKVIDNVVNHLLHNEKIMTSDYEGMQVVNIIERMYQSV